jgi:dTDP-4-amino-4,6-dideoxygalactose transaminase
MDSLDPSDFHTPTIGRYDDKQYATDIFRFMSDSSSLFDAKSKSISYENEMISLQPLLNKENTETLFENFVRANYCRRRKENSLIASLDLLIFAEKSLPVGYVTLEYTRDCVVIQKLQIICDENTSNVLISLFSVLKSWIFESLNINKLQINFEDTQLEEVQALLQNTSESVVDLTQSPKIVFKTYPIEPRDVKIILTAGPSITPVERNFSSNASAFGWNAHHSDFIESFERKFAEYVGTKYAIATSSCTGALHLSLLALGIGPGDEVILPNITWVATASAVTYVGATPVFADVNSDSWTIEIDSIKRLISAKTKVIIPVHLYGYGADMRNILKLAKENNIYVVEDAAPAIGTLIGSQAAGTIGDLGCYSFQGAKMLVTGEGGMIVTNSETLYQKVKKLQDHGRVPGTFWINEIGHKYKISNVAASIGLAQLISVERQIAKKREINSWYREFLSPSSQIEFQNEIPNSRSICWMTSITFGNIDRNELFKFLKLRGIDTRPTFPTISNYPIWNGKIRSEEKNSNFISESGVNLPSGVNLTKEKVIHVSNSILEFLEKS